MYVTIYSPLMVIEDCCSENEKETVSNKGCFCLFSPPRKWVKIYWRILCEQLQHHEVNVNQKHLHGHA